MSELLRRETLRKRNLFQSVRQDDELEIPFWDIVVITASDSEQEVAYMAQLQAKMGCELPASVKYHVFPDPVGLKIGNGGSTMAALDNLEQIYGKELDNYKVLMIHAGGYSQRLPSASVLGKIFTALPFGNPLYQMIEAKLMMYIDFPSRMKAGVFVTCADDIELFTIDGNWDFYQPGFTALGHPSPLKIGTTHGVFVLNAEDNKSDSEFSVQSAKCRRFLHKPSIEVMHREGAVVDADTVFTDSAYFMDRNTAKLLLKYYLNHRPLQCEIDAYGDFLQALGSEANDDYTHNTSNITDVTETIVQTRKEIFQWLKGTQLNVLLFKNSVFYHIGTTLEYLNHYCNNTDFQYELSCHPMVMTVGKNALTDASCPEVGSRCSIIHSKIGKNVQLYGESIVEYCLIENDVTIQPNCILSNIHLSSNLTVPENSFLHSVAVKQGTQKYFVTVAYSVGDNIKKYTSNISQLDTLNYAGRKISHVIRNVLNLNPADIWTNGTKIDLWHAKLFPSYKSHRDSVEFAVKMLNYVQTDRRIDLDSIPNRLSMADVIKQKDVLSILNYRLDLKAMVIS
ncbi:Fucose-1-phosphate guanylyltransferase [Trichoplax sp. H2]|nr:Fucose-1-phosphate guanylyltransferase [Trichoplax sp. H2]|eukprot:RDD41056.1 Fucose-1-phosphate guanylyltransferase [Trichoplax sp. H2]